MGGVLLLGVKEGEGIYGGATRRQTPVKSPLSSGAESGAQGAEPRVSRACGPGFQAGLYSGEEELLQVFQQRLALLGNNDISRHLVLSSVPSSL